MGETTVKYLGHNEGHMISKLEENLGDTDIKNFTVSPLYQIKCISSLNGDKGGKYCGRPLCVVPKTLKEGIIELSQISILQKSAFCYKQHARW